MAGIVALIDYGSGNLRSAEKALARASAEHVTGHEIRVTDDPAVVASAERIVLPGVGAFKDCMQGLSAIPRMVAALNEAVIGNRIPFLGICVGMQMMASVGREFGDTPGLGWIEGEVVRLSPSDPALKIPHMGWNELHIAKTHPVLTGIGGAAHAYFVHSFEFKARGNVIATTDYGGPIAAVVGRGNLIGTQFHPEKSQTLGLQLLANFLRWQP